MNKIKSLIVLVFILNIFLFAQSPLRIGAGFNVVLPTGDFADLANTGTGGSLLIDYSVSRKFTLGISGSYTSMLSKLPQIGADGKVADFYINSIDAILGGRYYLSDSFFCLLEGGLKYIRLFASIYDGTSNSNDEASSDYEPYFATNAGIGYKYNLAEGKSDFELTGLYQFVSGDVINFPNFTLRASIMIYL